MLAAPPRDSIIVAALAGVVVCVLLWTLGPHLGTAFLGIEAVDHYGTQWFYWFVDRQIQEGEGLGRTDLLFYPWGKDIFLHTGANLLDALLALPLRRLAGPVLGYNLFVLLGLAFNGWAFSRLAREFVDDQLALGVSTLLFAISPYVLYEAVEGRPTQAIVGVVPLVILQAWRCCERPGWRSPLLGGLLLALLGYQYWFYGFFTAASVAALVGWRLVRPPSASGGRAAIFVRAATMLGLALALVAPLVLPMLLRTEAGTGSVPGLLDVADWGWQGVAPVTVEGHAVGLLSWQPISGRAEFLMQRHGADALQGHQQLHGLAMLPFVLLALWRSGRAERGALLAMMTAALLLATGPLVVLGSVYVPQPVYLLLADKLGFLQRLWWPARAFSILQVLLLLCVALALAHTRSMGWLARASVVIGLCTAWMMGLNRAGLAPLPAWDASIPAGYRCLAEAGPGAVIELPYGRSQAHLYYQSAHGHPIMGGMLERNPVFSPIEAVEFRGRNTYVASLLSLSGAGISTPEWVSAADQQQVWDLGFRWVVLQLDAYRHADASQSPADQDRSLRTQAEQLATTEFNLTTLLGEPAFEGPRTAVWALFPGLDGDVLHCVDQAGIGPARLELPQRSPSATGAVAPLPLRRVEAWGRRRRTQAK